MTRAVLSFISRNSATIIALASVSIACFSLFVTIDSQKRDRDYKELLLRPHLQVDPSTGDYSVRLVNKGLGPALITDTAYFMNGQCVKLIIEDMSKDFSQSTYRKVISDIGARFITPAIRLPWHDNSFFSATTRHAEPGIPLPRQIIAAKDDVILFRFVQPFFDVFITKLGELPFDVRATFDDTFMTTAASLPILIKYCSMSGQYCWARPHDLPSCDFPHS
jgi:hypothetical protein